MLCQNTLKFLLPEPDPGLNSPEYVCMLSCFRYAIVDFTHAHPSTITVHWSAARRCGRTKASLSEARSTETYENVRRR